MGPFKSVAVSLPLLSTNPCPLLLTNQNGSGVSIRSRGNALFVQAHTQERSETRGGNAPPGEREEASRGCFVVGRRLTS